MSTETISSAASRSSTTSSRPSIFAPPGSDSPPASESRRGHTYSYSPQPGFSQLVEPRERTRCEKGPPNAIPATDFDPPERITSMILSDLTRDDTSLGSIAFSAGTTVESLTLWMSRPDIAHRLGSLEAAFALRIRVVCANFAAAALSSCRRIIQEYNEHESGYNNSMSSYQSRTLSCRNRETALEAGKLLLNLNRAYSPEMPRPSRSRPSSSPALAGEVSERATASKDGGGTCTPDPTATPSSPAIRETAQHPAPDDREATVDAARSTSAPSLHALRATRFPQPTTDTPSPSAPTQYPGGHAGATPPSDPQRLADVQSTSSPTGAQLPAPPRAQPPPYSLLPPLPTASPRPK